MKYKLVALDVDGTLLNDDYQITENTRRTVQVVHQTGGKLVLCTGRGPMNTLPVLNMLGLDGVMITHNGAATADSSGLRLLHQYPFSIRDIADIIGYCRDKGIHYDASTPFDMHVDNLGEESRAMYKKMLISPIQLGNIMLMSESIVKMSVFGDPTVLDLAQAKWQGTFESLKIIRSGDYFIDVMHRDASKGNALKKLAAEWDILPEEIIAVGNYFNDLDMIQFAGMGIAMENSPDEVKRLSNSLTASNNDEGVHLALLKYYFQNQSV